MRQLIFAATTLSIVITTGCLRKEYKKPIINGYYLYAYATNEDMTIMHFDKYGGIEIIGATVFSVGFDTSFIIAKQHPCIYPEKENKNITNYFIIPLKQPVIWTAQNIAVGPLSLQQFIDMRKTLKVADTLQFNTTLLTIK